MVNNHILPYALSTRRRQQGIVNQASLNTYPKLSASTPLQDPEPYPTLAEVRIFFMAILESKSNPRSLQG